MAYALVDEKSSFPLPNWCLNMLVSLVVNHDEDDLKMHGDLREADDGFEGLH